ncbi:S-adenosyl-L-methionine-dependent methyltransferase [Pleomassaria siparia CBS 279.74]|uniref:S-adenosyl-L-methionine-dependent methyltransferase n=1 Tax=Pleomassaria siparia CBS 279.74 TaxID=1314801 RepID=A0A6G1K0R5_9PLEO|nr:S-adenosyl-L-methionine-dependent methyltransferase [Pleomassaria siparia CBS 279.74]
MSSSTSTLPYAFKRHWMSSMRLNLNHFWMTRLMGHLLHPKVEVDDASTLQVADLGAGTGIWASELAAELPVSAVIHAFDVSDEQFPPEAWRAPNAHFSVVDCFKPFPDEYREKFDVVNIRFWLCIVNDDCAESLLANVLTLLKPGGYIQWFESLPLSARVVARNNGQITPGCDTLVNQWRKPAGHSSYEWVMNLASLFRKQNMEVIADETLSNPDQYQPIASQSWLVGIEEYLYQQKEGGQLEQLQKQLMEEAQGGAFVDVKYTLVLGRKSSVPIM